MFNRLYPAESNHLLDIETLAGPDIHFFVARRERRGVGCGAHLASRPDYGEVKRIYVQPAARGLAARARDPARLEDEARAIGLTTAAARNRHPTAGSAGPLRRAGYRAGAAFGDYPAQRSLQRLHGKAAWSERPAFLAHGAANA